MNCGHSFFPEREAGGRLLSALTLRPWDDPLRNRLLCSTPLSSVPIVLSLPVFPWGDALEERITPQYLSCVFSTPIPILPALFWGEPLSELPSSTWYLHHPQYLDCTRHSSFPFSVLFRVTPLMDGLLCCTRAQCPYTQEPSMLSTHSTHPPCELFGGNTLNG